MTDHSGLDARLSRFLVDQAPRRVPERLIDATRDVIAGTRQRRRFRGLRWLNASTTLRRLVASGGLILVMSVAAILVLSNRFGSSNGVHPSSSSVPSTSVSPSPKVSSSPTFSSSPCAAGQGSCLGILQPGAYSSASFVPVVRYRVPDGWNNTMDVRGEFDLQWSAGGQHRYPDGLTFHDGISVFRRPVAESSTTRTPATGVGKSANDLARWLAAHVDLSASAPTAITIGGASGFRVLLSVPTGTRSVPDHCTTDHGDPRCVSLFLSDDPAAYYGFGLVGPEIAVVDILVVPSGDTVLVVIDDADGINQPELEAAATPVVNSLEFSP